MFPNEFYAKTAMRKEQIEVKLEIGCDGLEYQLLPSDFDPTFRHLLNRDEKRRIIEKTPASCVHLPLDNCNVEDVLCNNDAFLMEESMRIAQMSADVKHERCLCVVHITQTPAIYGKRRLDEMGRELERLFTLFPDVDIVVENLPPFLSPELGIFDVSNGMYDANVRFVEHFPFEGRLMTCLDVCHAQITKKYMGAMGQAFDPDRGFGIDYSLDKFFEMNAPHIGLVHLATITGNGYKKGHGTGFDHESGEGMDVLEKVFSLYDDLDLLCPVTIEVREDDFLASDIYRKSKAAVDSLVSRNSRNG